MFSARHALRSTRFSRRQSAKALSPILRSEGGAVKVWSPDSVKAYSPMVRRAFPAKATYLRSLHE